MTPGISLTGMWIRRDYTIGMRNGATYLDSPLRNKKQRIGRSIGKHEQLKELWEKNGRAVRARDVSRSEHVNVGLTSRSSHTARGALSNQFCIRQKALRWQV
jgi:hypothetical protein